LIFPVVGGGCDVADADFGGAGLVGGGFGGGLGFLVGPWVGGGDSGGGGGIAGGGGALEVSGIFAGLGALGWVPAGDAFAGELGIGELGVLGEA